MFYSMTLLLLLLSNTFYFIDKYKCTFSHVLTLSANITLALNIPHSLGAPLAPAFRHPQRENASDKFLEKLQQRSNGNNAPVQMEPSSICRLGNVITL